MPYAKTLYGMFLKGNVLDKCQEKANQTAGFSSTCAAHSLDSIQQPQMDSLATQLRSDTSPGYFSSYCLSPCCPPIFKLPLAVVDSLSAHC